MEIEEIKYKTFESEKIIQITSWYAITSLILVSIVMRIWLPKPTELYSLESLFLILYSSISFWFLITMAKHSKRRALINKLPSTDILKICLHIKKQTHEKSWQITPENFNSEAMSEIFGNDIKFLIPSHDYLSYMLSERLITILAVTDLADDPFMNPLHVKLSNKGEKCLHIYEQSMNW